MRVMFKYRRDRLRVELVNLLQSTLGWMFNQPMLLRIRTGNHIYFQNNVRYLNTAQRDSSSPFISERENVNNANVSWAGLHKNDSITGREIFSFPDGNISTYSKSILIVQTNTNKPHNKFDQCSYLDVEIINEMDNNYTELNRMLENTNQAYCLEIE